LRKKKPPQGHAPLAVLRLTPKYAFGIPELRDEIPK